MDLKATGLRERSRTPYACGNVRATSSGCATRDKGVPLSGAYPKKDCMTHTLLTLRPVEADLLSVLEGTVAQRKLTQEIAAAAHQRQVRRVIFVGVGGSWASSIPVSVQLGSQSSSFGAENLNAADFTDLHLDTLDSRTLVVGTSHSGETPETVRAVEAAKERGALVVSLATSAQNSLADAADFTLAYRSERTITSAKYALLTELGASLLEALDGKPAAELRTAMDAIPDATLDAVHSSEPNVASIAAQFFDEDRTHILATGPLLGLGYMLSVCYLVEMQSKHTTHFSTADFFHGPFEAALGSHPYILLQGEDASRHQADRVRAFLDRYNDNYGVLDTADFALPGVATSQRGAVAHIPQASVVMRLAEHFEPLTGQNLDGRTYMHKVEY